MAQLGNQLHREQISCSICLDLLKDPVTATCGHSHCMKCIETHWDKEDKRKIYTCPQCREVFLQKPDLKKNTMLADLVEELKRIELQAAPADHCYAGPEDVACDVCTGRKLKAQKSCLQCLASFCEKHLQPHFEAAPLQKHKLTEPSKKLQESICSRHDEVMKLFCRTDQQPICYLCSVDQHRGHDTVSAAAERTERQKELKVSRQNIQQRIQDKERDVKLLQQEVEAVNRSADEAVDHCEKIFSDVICIMLKKRSDVTEQVRSQQKTEVSQAKELQEKLEKEITELKRRDAQLAKLSTTEDHNQFLQSFLSLSQLSESTDSSSISILPLSFFEDLTAAVSDFGDKLLDVLCGKQTNISQKVEEADVSPSPPKSDIRAELLKHSCYITLNPNTAHGCLLLSDRNRKATLTRQQQTLSRQRDRFTGYCQVLSKESLTGRCYWEVEWSGGVHVAVAYKNISKVGMRDECAYGHNDKSWALDCVSKSYNLLHNSVSTPYTDLQCSRIGVYLDHSAGILSFYSVSDTMTLLHTVQTKFTQPLHAGLRLFYPGIRSFESAAKLCDLK
ncbi:tripartite motif-containing protein 16-like [Cheilinus undulatus]|uniref:tripartite motif-containing protein 16-like n=1 Tax=Cheilinus undulatus TaxID=241271 RepID=UPI001BD69A0F|nr:tripartite motif-containing protein 16-like [Cheilinus undulatus]